MRRLVFVFLILIVAMSILWIFAGRQISLFIDGYKTIETASSRIEGITFDGISIEGRGTAGVLLVDDPSAPAGPTAKRILRLELIMPTGQSPHFGTTKNGETALSFAGKVFTFSPLLSGGTDEMIDYINIGRPPADEASISLRHSVLSWVEPLNLNFMTGKSPSWKRHQYYQLIWKKPTGARLEMLWRYEQYFYPEDRWTEAFMTRPGSTGLIRIDISNASR